MYPSSCKGNKIEKISKENVITKRLNIQTIIFLNRIIEIEHKPTLDYTTEYTARCPSIIDSSKINATF